MLVAMEWIEHRTSVNFAVLCSVKLRVRRRTWRASLGVISRLGSVYLLSFNSFLDGSEVAGEGKHVSECSNLHVEPGLLDDRKIKSQIRVLRSNIIARL